MQTRNTTFLLKDGSIDTNAAMAAGRRVRSEAFHDMFRPRRQARLPQTGSGGWTLAILPFFGFFFSR